VETSENDFPQFVLVGGKENHTMQSWTKQVTILADETPMTKDRAMGMSYAFATLFPAGRCRKIMIKDEYNKDWNVVDWLESDREEGEYILLNSVSLPKEGEDNETYLKRAFAEDGDQKLIFKQYVVLVHANLGIDSSSSAIVHFEDEAFLDGFVEVFSFFGREASNCLTILRRPRSPLPESWTRPSLDMAKLKELTGDDGFIAKPIQSSKKQVKFEKRRGKRDPNAPKEPLSAFMFFSSNKRDEVRQANPEVRFADVGKKLKEMWTQMTLTEKQPYTIMELKDKSRYNMDMAFYKPAQEDEDEQSD
jgi:hypothetical protein